MRTPDYPSGDGGSTPTPSLQFVELEKRKATDLVETHHYLKRACPVSWAWGIKVGDKILGVLTIGKPCSWSVICGVVRETLVDMKKSSSRSKDVFELNRLWVDDSLPKNTE